MQTNKPYKVALVEWTPLLEDFLDNIGLSLDDFREHMTGSWLFGYIDALKTAEVETVLFCFSARITKPLNFTHKPTGAEVWILPTTGLYRRIRKVILNPYTKVVEEAAVNTKGWRRWWYSLLLNIAPYFATPLKSFYTHIKKTGCTAILCQDYEHARFDVTVLTAKLLRLPVFASFQGGNWQFSYFEKWIRPFTIKACKGLIVASGIEMTRLKLKYKLPDEKLKQIFNPVDLTHWQGEEKNEARRVLEIEPIKRIAIWHGRIDYYRKGIDLLIAAWEKANTESGADNWELIILGSGVNANLLEMRLAQSPLKNIRWINKFINDRKVICSYLRAADIYIFPSRNEGFPVAPLEAMACGLPLVASDAPGIADILKEGEESGGLMLKQEDVTAFAETIAELLLNKEKTERLSTMAVKNMHQNFSLYSIGVQLKQFIFYNKTKNGTN